ncbi:Uu.00g041590.m01.CDS01 [Anthostomella pinea]|uniref:Uu.00g041590.m01.CDS01 n=1 Tax=Anthostomella pinea TaxID=933095 RepID=A0AAI8VAF4_9PEZI|nr:Uu.00g041590.m01.CDS01 [Anthostomella pinea]
MDTVRLPDFDSLPKVKDMPQGCAWGIFDQGGEKDLLGTLNLLTPAVRKAACAEARDGVSISLNWPLNAMPFPVPGRAAPTHKQMTLKESGLSEGTGWDDELHFNTQMSSQWDSLVHWQHQPSGLAYNGIAVTKEALDAPTTAANSMPTLDHWHAAGGLVARGVLIDFKAWAEKKARTGGKTGEEAVFHPLDGHRITVEEVETVAKDQGVEFQHGDVLIVRTGLTEVLQAPTPEDFAKLQDGTQSGMHGVAESAKWLWNKHFAAVAGDAIAFEALMPLKEDGTVGSPNDLYLHPWLLSLFGMPIGELWDLKALSTHCEKSGRYSFMLTSVPLNIPGLVGSPPNAMAVF